MRESGKLHANIKPTDYNHKLFGKHENHLDQQRNAKIRYAVETASDHPWKHMMLLD